MTWTIGILDLPEGDMPARHYLTIESALTACLAWKRLTEAGRVAVLHAWRNERHVRAHPNTIHALVRHGFVKEDNVTLTDAGWVVATWMAPKRDGGRGYAD